MATDYSAFRSRGGKLIICTGLSLDTFADYESVAKAMGVRRAGPARRVVEKGTAPDSIAASHATNGQVDRTRPLRAYSAVAHYDGAGSIDDAANFSCVVR
jgi:hypothetical protein